MYSVTQSCLNVTPWTVAHQAPLSMGFSRQEYWSGLPFPPPGDLPDPGIEPTSSASLALAGGFFTTEPLGKPQKLDELKSPSKSGGLWAPFFLMQLPLYTSNAATPVQATDISLLIYDHSLLSVPPVATLDFFPTVFTQQQRILLCINQFPQKADF